MNLERNRDFIAPTYTVLRRVDHELDAADVLNADCLQVGTRQWCSTTELITRFCEATGVIRGSIEVNSGCLLAPILVKSGKIAMQIRIPSIQYNRLRMHP